MMYKISPDLLGFKENFNDGLGVTDVSDMSF